jgi:CTP:molybdopterin cytidylyltransferase MocA
VTVHGLLLAAGAGRRMGTPKALLRDPDGTPWSVRSVAALLDGGCDAVTVVLGAGAEEAARLVPRGPVTVVVADDWAEGMAASLRAGLAALPVGPDAAVVSLVDLPDVDAAVVHRVVAAGTLPATLARATYDGVPGHPVVLGRDHWEGITTTASGDSGARDYLRGRDVTLVECGDLATGRDVDHR